MINKILALILAASFTLSGCETFRQTIQTEIASPEFQAFLAQVEAFALAEAIKLLTGLGATSSSEQMVITLKSQIIAKFPGTPDSLAEAEARLALTKAAKSLRAQSHR